MSLRGPVGIEYSLLCTPKPGSSSLTQDLAQQPALAPAPILDAVCNRRQLGLRLSHTSDLSALMLCTSL